VISLDKIGTEQKKGGKKGGYAPHSSRLPKISPSHACKQQMKTTRDPIQKTNWNIKIFRHPKPAVPQIVSKNSKIPNL
jgi:hypothetical protein